MSLDTVTKLLVDAGRVCQALHGEPVRNVGAKRVQCDEIWSFTFAKQKNVADAKAAPEGAGDTWTWTALDTDSKLIVSWLDGGWEADYADAFMQDDAVRLTGSVQLTTDGHKAYLQAVEGAFGADVDYAMLVKHTVHPLVPRASTAPANAQARSIPLWKANRTPGTSAPAMLNARTFLRGCICAGSHR